MANQAVRLGRKATGQATPEGRATERGFKTSLAMGSPVKGVKPMITIPTGKPPHGRTLTIRNSFLSLLTLLIGSLCPLSPALAGQKPTRPASFNFSLSNTGNESVNAGSSVGNTINTSLVSGNSQQVSFSIAGLPSGANGAFSKVSCVPSCSSQLTISTTAATSAGSFPITVTAKGGGITKSTSFNLTVVQPAPSQQTTSAGTSLPSGWFSAPWASGGNASMSGNLIVVDGALAGINTFYGSGNSLEFVATFSGDANQHIGLGTDFTSAPWAIFSTGSGGGLYARTNNGSTGIDTLILGNWLGTAHRYHIDWNTSGIVFSIDGTVVATHSISITGQTRPLGERLCPRWWCNNTAIIADNPIFISF